MYGFFKRGMDIFLSAILLLILSPILIVLMVFIRLESEGNPLFMQTRIGKNSKPFLIYKLRTMYTSAPSSVATGELQEAEKHITHIGKFLRKTSLDELPQLYNVLRGEMSLIGPRPLVPEEGVIHELRKQQGAYCVRPGITGWAQVNGRDCVQPTDKARLDAEYAHNVSFAFDIKIICWSVICVLTARGVREGSTPYDPEIDEENRHLKIKR